jgi:excisionase family DNA binding protein
MKHEKLLNDREAAEYLNLGVQTLRDWRCTGRVDLPYIKLGGAVRYTLEDLEAFVAANRRNTTEAAR